MQREQVQYLDEAGQRHEVSSTDVNAYLPKITGEGFIGKGFRTRWDTTFKDRYRR